MVFISASVQRGLRVAATHAFGPDGEAVLAAAAQQSFDQPIDQLTYTQVPLLLESVERTAQVQIGQARAFALAEALGALQEDVDGNVSGRLVDALTKRVGQAAEPLLRSACNDLSLSPEAIEPSLLPALAEAIHATTLPLLGEEMAGSLRLVVREAAHARSVDLTAEILDAAQRHLGEHGDVIVQGLCHEHLEIALEQLNPSSLAALALAVERYGPAVVAGTLTSAFTAEATQTLISPAVSLRQQIVDLTCAVVGPLAETFLDEVCAERGLPFSAVDYEHLMWLAEVLRTEIEPLAGRAAADRLARDLRAFLTGQR